MSANQSTTLSMLVVLALVALALSRPTRGFWSALFTHQPISFDLGFGAGLDKVPNTQDPTSALTPEQKGQLGDAIGARKPSWSLRRP